MQTIIRSLFLAVFVFVPGTFAFGQNTKTDSMATIVSEMSESNVYELSYTVGYAGSISEQYLRYKLLVTLASVPQLINLATEHKNAVVRLYAYQALKRTKEKLSAKIVQQFQSDHTLVNTLNGCIAEEKAVSFLSRGEYLDLSNSIPDQK